MFPRRVFALLAALSAVPILSCGGGGGSLAPPVQPPVNTAALPITADNARDITAAVLEGVVSTFELIGATDLIGLPAVSSSVPGTAKIGFPVMTAQDVFMEVIPCDSGEVSVEWNDADDSLTISTGDTFDFIFDMCFFQDAGATLDGLGSITNIVVGGDPFNQIAPWAFAGTFGFVELSATDAGGEAVIDGSLNVDLSSDNNVVLDLIVATDSLSVDVNGMNETISNFVATQTLNVGTGTQRITADGTYSSTILQGEVDFETLDEFVVIGDDNPSSGQMLISDDTSSVLVTVLGNINVQLGIDLDRDGMIDETLVVAWDDLDIG